MNKTKLCLAVSAAIFLSACDDSNDPPTTNEDTRTLSITTDTQENPTELQDITVESTSSRSLSEENEYSYELTESGYVHVLRNDGYIITITDELGTYIYRDQTISDGETLEFQVTGEATIAFSHEDFDSTDFLTTPYYTVATDEPVDISAEYDNVEIKLTNTKYALVTLLPPEDDSLLEDGSARINGGVPTSVSNESVPNVYSYDYVTTTDETVVTANTSDGDEITINGVPENNKQYVLTYTDSSSDGSGGGGIIIDPGWDDEIEVPIEGGGVVSYNEILGAVNLSTDSDTLAVSGDTNGQAVWVYDNNIGNGDALLKNTSFSFSVSEFPSDYYVNIYLISEDSDKVSGVIYADGSVSIGDDSFDDYDSFKNSETYSNHYVRNYRDNYTNTTDNTITSVTGNFFLRLGDSSYDGTDPFTIDSWNLQILNTSQPDIVIDPDQVVGYGVAQVNADGTISGVTSSDYATRIYIPVDGDKTLEGYDFSISMDFDAANGSKGFVNLYLENDDGTTRIDIIYPGDDTNEVCYATDSRGNTTGPMHKCDLSAYKDYIVRNYTDSNLANGAGGIIRGNYIWRSADSNSIGDNDEFTINQYSLTYTEPSTVPVIDPNNISGAQNITTDDSGNVSGDITLSLATAFCDTVTITGSQTLSEFSDFDISTTPVTYTNIYIENSEGQQYRINREIAGNYTVYIRDTENETAFSGAKWTDISESGSTTWADIMSSDYAAMMVIQWREGGVYGNFLTRFTDKSQDPNFTITSYDCGLSN
jgi:hypothetical protein